MTSSRDIKGMALAAAAACMTVTGCTSMKINGDGTIMPRATGENVVDVSAAKHQIIVDTRTDNTYYIDAGQAFNIWWNGVDAKTQEQFLATSNAKAKSLSLPPVALNWDQRGIPYLAYAESSYKYRAGDPAVHVFLPNYDYGYGDPAESYADNRGRMTYHLYSLAKLDSGSAPIIMEGLTIAAKSGQFSVEKSLSAFPQYGGSSRMYSDVITMRALSDVDGVRYDCIGFNDCQKLSSIQSTSPMFFPEADITAPGYTVTLKSFQRKPRAAGVSQQPKF